MACRVIYFPLDQKKKIYAMACRVITWNNSFLPKKKKKKLFQNNKNSLAGKTGKIIIDIHT